MRVMKIEGKREWFDLIVDNIMVASADFNIIEP